MKRKPLEYCFACGEPTGKAGPGDGSHHCDCGAGPLCDECWDMHNCPMKDQDEDEDEDESDDALDEPTASCEICGCNIYAEEDDGTDTCDQCQWLAKQ